ncbi:MAG: hypothetical protein HOC71_06415 [Candidatus Latescibacteria bacterium]|nr:hypothetical protein [Candidatus Latescibacterota bacterium]
MSALISTYIWLGIFIVFAVVFFSIASWVIVRGGKDVWEILTIAKNK